MKRRISTIVAALFVSLFVNGISWGQFNIISVNRTLTVSPQQNLDSTDYSAGYKAIYNPASDANTSTGVYNNKIYGNTELTSGGVNFIPVGTGSPSQNTNVSASGLSGSVIAAAQGGDLSILSLGGLVTSSITSTSTYSVEFSVSARTPVTLSEDDDGDMLGSGKFGSVSASFGFDDIFSGGSASSNQVPDFFDFNQFGAPKVYNLTLLPGSPYLLYATATAVGAMGGGSNDQASATVNFSLTVVPEPASLSVVAPFVGVALARRRRR